MLFFDIPEYSYSATKNRQKNNGDYNNDDT
jgi:hypothetical protein